MPTLEVRFHGRAGQGIVTAADLLAVAAGVEGKYSQAFPFFGSEKRGPPVVAYCRISDEPITTHEQIYDPHIVVVADETVMESVNVAAGLRENGLLIVNTKKKFGELIFLTPPPASTRIVLVDGTSVALRVLGKPILNTLVLGALVKTQPVVKMDSLHAAIEKRFEGELAKKNVTVVDELYNLTQPPLSVAQSTA